MSRRQYGSISFIIGLESQDPQVRQLAEATVDGDPMLQTSWVDCIQLLGTLRVVLDLSLELRSTEPWQSCIRSLLRAVDVCGESCLSGRQEALPTRKKAHLTRRSSGRYD